MKKNFGQNLIVVCAVAIVLGIFSYPAISQMIGGGMIGNTFSGGQVANPILLPDGSVNAPGWAWASETNTGAYKSAGGRISFSTGGVVRVHIDSGNVWLASDTLALVMGAAADLKLVHDAADTLALKNGNNDQHSRIYGANGTYRDEGTISELLTIAAAASSTTTMSIPANAVVYGVSVRVTVVIPTAATFTVTGNTSGTVFNTAAVSTAATSTDVGTALCPYTNGAAQTIRITPNLSPADNTGRVRVTLHYYFINPATS